MSLRGAERRSNLVGAVLVPPVPMRLFRFARNDSVHVKTNDLGLQGIGENNIPDVLQAAGMLRKIEPINYRC